MARFWRDTDGASAAEYAILLAVIGTVMAVAASQLGEAIGKAQNECDVGDGKGGEPKGWGSVSHEVRRQIRDAVKNAFKLDPNAKVSAAH